MLNRKDRIALRRNRSAVSWLCILSIILAIWIKNLYGDIDYAKFERDGALHDLNELHLECSKRGKTIDSLTKVITYRDTIKTTSKKIYKAVVKKDTIIHKTDTIKPLKNLEDSLNDM